MSRTIEPTIEADRTFGRLSVSGGELRDVTLRYAMYGELNERRDNAVLVCHALSGSARVADWWPQLFGAGGVFDPSRHCVVGVNAVGSYYGSTGPQSIDPRAGEPYRA